MQERELTQTPRKEGMFLTYSNRLVPRVFYNIMLGFNMAFKSIQFHILHMFVLKFEVCYTFYL